MSVSIIIVYYKAKKELFGCLVSLKKSHPNVTLETIVVDNDEEKTIENDLKKRFPWVLYVKSPRNIGFGAGNNLGAKHAKGKYLFFLNPDTIVLDSTIDILLNFLEKNKNVGIVAPLLLNSSKKPYPLQGSVKLTPLRAIVCLSFLHKIFPNSVIAKNYWMFDWNKRDLREVDVAPGTAFMISQNIFRKLGGFDEQFFLFFEENDICMRLQKLGKKIYINPRAKIVHLWGRSTKQKREVDTIFAKSRHRYFKKYYGLFQALLVEMFVR